jgi:hypothetical protein
VYIMPNYVNSHFAFDKNRRIVGEGISFCWQLFDYIKCTCSTKVINAIIIIMPNISLLIKKWRVILCIW